jgi:hypothetical protein
LEQRVTFFFDTVEIAVNLPASNGELLSEIVNRAGARGESADHERQTLGLAVLFCTSAHTTRSPRLVSESYFVSFDHQTGTKAGSSALELCS